MKANESEALQARNLIAETESLLAARERTLLATHRLCSSDLAILERLAKKGPKPVNQIAPKVGLTSGSMTTAVQRLKRRQFVTTTRDKKDARKVRVVITPDGQAILETLTTARAAIFTPILHSLNNREGKVLSALLKKLRKASR